MPAILALTVSSEASARDYYYFNKPGIGRETYLSDRIRCEELAVGAQVRKPDMTAIHLQAWSNPNLTAGQAAVAAGLSSFFLSFVAAAERRRLAWEIERICLADKGYRRFRMDKREFREIEKLKDGAARIDRWFALASADRPRGQEMFE